MSHRTNRRRFLQTTAATGVGFWVAGGLRAEEEKQVAQRTHRHRLHRRGRQGLERFGRRGPSTATWSPSATSTRTRLNNAGEKRFPKAKRYTDFRKMLDEMGKSIDAVTVSTPDHMPRPGRV